MAKKQNILDLNKIESNKNAQDWAPILRKNLESEIVILKMIQAQIVPKCSHPKKDHIYVGSNTCQWCGECSLVWEWNTESWYLKL